MQEDNYGNIKVSGISERSILTAEEAMKYFYFFYSSLLWTGNKNRKTASTSYNSMSSRSHSIFTVSVEKINKSTKEKNNFNINFVDLAGSERLKNSGATTERFKEGVSINSGLLALSKVIMALSDKLKKNNQSTTHIPYRESKLTRLLKDSLSGSSITVMIGCVSPSGLNVDETLNTLNYSSFARSVKIQPMINVEVNDSFLLKEEIKKLKDQLDYFKARSYELLPDDKSLNSYNLQTSKIIETNYLNENNFNNNENIFNNSVNSDNLIIFEQETQGKENVKSKFEYDKLKAENEEMRKMLENYRKESVIINILNKAE